MKSYKTYRNGSWLGRSIQRFLAGAALALLVAPLPAVANDAKIIIENRLTSIELVAKAYIYDDESTKDNSDATSYKVVKDTKGSDFTKETISVGFHKCKSEAGTIKSKSGPLYLQYRKTDGSGGGLIDFFSMNLTLKSTTVDTGSPGDADHGHECIHTVETSDETAKGRKVTVVKQSEEKIRIIVGPYP